MKALIIIDIQNGLTQKKALCNESLFFETVNRAISLYRDAGAKIIFVQHNNNQLVANTYDWEIDPRVHRRNDDCVVQKGHGNAFHLTPLRQILLDGQIDSITICGLVSHGCVLATCLGGKAEGFDTSVLKNGHTNWNKDALRKIADTERVLAENGIHLEE
ncbi:MAG TPA: isochorismatase family protein [Prolixibacteraceae bacterium]|nr:isochorismatase family protein [Prolixibacteraceae bacterium]